MPRLDDLDRKLLDIVQDDCTLTAATLSERVALSPSAIARRLDRMRAEGVIQREVAVVNPDKVGRRQFLIVGISLERESYEIAERFRQSIVRCPQVVESYFVTGTADYVLIVAVQDMDEWDRLSRHLIFDNPYVASSSTNVVIRAVKRGTKIAVLDDAGD